jgi:membrane protease YdiL (CAAX protease family)
MLFGLGHFYAGPGVALMVGFGALFSGVYFLIAGRNLWALILAHGIWDTLGITLIYLNGTPST